MATNPWTKKNPWLSLWLSGANTVLSHARGQAIAEAQRQANAMMNQSFEQMMRWWGGRDKDAPVAFIGKGVVFDTGGISIKPAAGMEDMKGDMGGAAAVLGAPTNSARFSDVRALVDWADEL